MESIENTPPSSASQDTTQANSDGQDGDNAFLVHFQDTLSQHTLPDIDNQRLIRQKRRRTSPEDHTTLEAEYERNPKPDKTARMEIVNRVALGEKEVQIWFQNRRQMTRRKSRPLLPHEVISNFYTSQGCSNIASSSSLANNGHSQPLHFSSQSSVISSQTTADSLPTIPPGKGSSNSTNESLGPVDESTTAGGIEGAQRHQNNSHSPVKHTQTPCASDASVEDGHHQSPNLTRSLSQTLPTKRRPGYFANHRSAPFIIHDDKVSATPSSDPSGLDQSSFNRSNTGSSQPLKRTTSLIRLSLTIDGKAEVTTGTGNTPSPPRSRPGPPDHAARRPNAGLQRSYSAVEPNTKPGLETFSVPYPRRLMTGRSRDARTWEFYCDSDARNALTEQAEREESGSAIAAISLIRSRSNNRKVMAANPNKRNAHAQKPDSTKRLKADEQKSSKPKLARATSSVARLQTTQGNAQKHKFVTPIDEKPKPGSQMAVDLEGDGDSDKENWEPGTRTSNPSRRRPNNVQQATRILEDSLRVPSQSSSLDTLMHSDIATRRRPSTKSFSSEEKENSRPEVDNEVAAFMNKSVPREVEDLDCVQHLLSLSQAAWQ